MGGNGMGRTRSVGDERGGLNEAGDDGRGDGWLARKTGEGSCGQDVLRGEE